MTFCDFEGFFGPFLQKFENAVLLLKLCKTTFSL